MNTSRNKNQQCNQYIDDNAIDIEKKLTHKTIGLKHNHDIFDAFQVMGSCEFACVGGECLEDVSKITCGLNEGEIEAP